MAMGQAETDVGQAMDAGRANAEQQLQSFGIDPSSGRYAALETAQAAQKAAAQAGAGQMARQRTEDTGRQLRAQAINATLANQNTGAAMRGVAKGLMDTASGALKYVPTSQNSQSQSRNDSSSHQQGATPQQQQQRQQGGGGGGGGGNPARFSGNPSSTNNGTSQNRYDAFGGDTYGNTQPNAGIMDVPDGGGADPSSLYGSLETGGITDPYAGAYGGYNTGGQDLSYDQYSPSASSYDQGGGWGTPASGDTSSGYDTSNTNWGDNGGWTSDYENSGGGYAQGGAIPDETTGGQVPMGASPSQGAQTDDVPANLNAGEFVVPRDVAKWKGEEFFQKLIMQSRKARMTAPGKGQPGPSHQGAPRFASQAMGA